MGTTAHGYPYPEPTDPVAQGAAAIKALADAIEAKVYAATKVATVMNATNVSVASSGAVSLGTVASVPVAVGDYVLATGNTFATMVGGTTATVMNLAFEASGGGIAYVAQAAPDGERALFGGGGGQTQQIPMAVTKVFGPMTAAGTFSVWDTRLDDVGR